LKNYYEILGINQTATEMEIKKAYFNQVRKYPPDRYQEEFMAIREAYELLSDKKTKYQYDSMNNMSAFVINNFEIAKKWIEENELGAAISILEELVSYAPNLNVIKVLLGETYEQNENSGKAIKIFEELVKEEPNNAGFQGHLAYSFLDRGWHKKAIIAFTKAIEMDADNLSFYLGLNDAHVSNNDLHSSKNILTKAISKFKESNSESTSVYYNLIQTDIMLEDKEDMLKHLDALTKLAVINKDIKDNTAWTLAQLAKILLSANRTNEAEEIVKRALELSPNNEDILAIQENINSYENLENSFELLLNDARFHKNLKELIEIEIYKDELTGMDLMGKDGLIAVNELIILEDFHFFSVQIMLLEITYPQLYNVKREFFDATKDFSNRKDMIKKRKVQKQKFDALLRKFNYTMDFDDDDLDEDDDDDFMEEPFVREEVKVGRNDPCPCGSGKKYKKCCG